MAAVIFILVVVALTAWATAAITRRVLRRKDFQAEAQVRLDTWLASPERRRLLGAPRLPTGPTSPSAVPPPPGRHSMDQNFVVGPCRHSLTRDEARELFARLCEYLSR